ncbi:MAG: phosphatidate cytidylyltransferase [Treponema sp.]|nr:phosphatidate cytidylyltransferase [Treponema sp.]
MKKFRTKFLLKELFRKSIHLCSALVPFFLDHFFTLTVCLLFCALIGYTVSEFLRLKGYEIPLISTITEIAARKRDEDKFVLGPVTLVIGIIITALSIKNPECRRIGIFALAFGDGLASLCGKFFGRIHISLTKGKTAAGSIACFTAVFLSTFCVCGNTQTSLTIALVAMLIEILPLADMDNIIIPPAIGWLAVYLYGSL